MKKCINYYQKYKYIMNILEAYIIQNKYLTIIISSVDINVLKEIGSNLAQDFSTEIIDLTDYYQNVKSLEDLEKVKDQIEKQMENNQAIKIVIAPVMPSEFFKFRMNYHINISLNYKKLEEKQIESHLISLETEVKNNNIRVNRYINLHKYDNTKLLEDEIFDTIMRYIEKRLDRGEYLSRKEEFSEPETTQSFENTNDKIDNKIMEDIELSETKPLSDVNIEDMSLSDINMDSEITPINNFSENASKFITSSDNASFKNVSKNINSDNVSSENTSENTSENINSDNVSSENTSENTLEITSSENESSENASSENAGLTIKNEYIGSRRLRKKLKY